jgi:dihydrofolate reductase
MRKIKLYIAVSLDGKIARPDGSVDWLDAVPNPEKLDYGYSEFYKTCDTTLQGYNTYQVLLSFGIPFPYPDKKNYVFTTKSNLEDTGFVEFVGGDILSFTQNLKGQEGDDIWLIGGGKLNTTLFNAGLIDEFQIFVMPVIVGEGIPLFGLSPNESHLRLTGTKTYGSGVVQLSYSKNTAVPDK